MDQYMIINLTQKELEEEFRKQFTSLGENNEKYITFTVLIEKEGTRIDANREEIRKEQLAYYNLLIVPDLWQVHYQILLTIFLKEFIETCKFGYNDKKYKSCRIKYKCCDIFLKYRNFMMM